MDVRSDTDKSDEVLLPGFRFHPTDEELVGFYLRRKIQQKPLSIELIRQLDIYKHDPWDLPKLASTGEKEWYFYCPRDRKYRNSARPNRVTGAGFWKATGTDRPIYSSEGAKCIGLKKSLVFYRGRAARGIKTDWMMHEFRLPSLSDPSLAKRPFDKGIPANDSWTICRIFKKTSSMAQRALSHSWGPPLPGTSETDLFSALQSVKASPFALESSSCTPQEAAPANRFTDPQDGSSCKVINFNCGSSYAHASNKEVHDGPIILPFETQTVPKNSDFASLHLGAVLGVINSMDKDSPGTDFGQPEQCSGFALDWPASMNGIIENAGEDLSSRKPGNEFGMNNEWGNPRRGSFPFDLGADFSDEWRCNIPWESLLPSPIAPAEISNSCSTEKCYT